MLLYVRISANTPGNCEDVESVPDDEPFDFVECSLRQISALHIPR